MKSYVSAPHAITQALNELKPLLGGDFKFTSGNEYTERHAELTKAAAVEFISGKASVGSAAPVNEFLKSHGFTIEFDNPRNPNDIVTAGVVNILVRWANELDKTTLLWGKSRSVPAVSCDHYGDFASALHPHPVFQLPVKENFQVHLTKADRDLPDNFLGLQLHLQRLQSSLTRGLYKFEDLILPMVNLDVSGDLPIFNDIHMLGADGQAYVTASGKFQGILKLNEKGARAKAAAGGMILCSSVRMPKPDYIMDEPFWFWIARDGVVYFAALICGDCLSEPTNLD